MADRAGPSQIHFQGRSYCHVVRSLRRVRLFVTAWTAARQAPLSFTISQSLLKLMSIESVMPSTYLILCHPLLLLPSIFPSIRVFSSESALLIKWLKYWTFSYSISPSSEYSGLISFRIDWFDLLAFQGTLESLPQHHSSKWLLGFSGQLLDPNSHCSWGGHQPVPEQGGNSSHFHLVMVSAEGQPLPWSSRRAGRDSVKICIVF